MKATTFKNSDFKEYHVTGTLYRSKKRFKMVYSSFMHADMINLCNGSIFGVKEDGKRTLLKRVS